VRTADVLTHSPVTYTIVCRPEGDVWAVRVLELGSIETQVAQVHEAKPKMRGLIAHALGVREDSFALRVRTEAARE
jgi:hypothetical protein